MKGIEIIEVDSSNISEYPAVCFLNPKNEGYQKKLGWLTKRFSDGLKIKQLYLENERKCLGYIEYVPGEYAWRSVDARGYMFIHCIWVYPNISKLKGYGSLLVGECVKDAEKAGMHGAAVVVSEGAFMAGKALFLKNGFESVAGAGVKPSSELMVKTMKNGPVPEFRDWEQQLSRYEGLHIIYSNQCPWVARSINDMGEIAAEKGLKLEITELANAEQAQNAPSVYAVFNLVNNGKLLADRYISSTRFLNILNKEVIR